MKESSNMPKPGDLMQMNTKSRKWGSDGTGDDIPVDPGDIGIILFFSRRNMKYNVYEVYMQKTAKIVGISQDYIKIINK